MSGIDRFALNLVVSATGADMFELAIYGLLPARLSPIGTIPLWCMAAMAAVPGRHADPADALHGSTLDIPSDLDIPESSQRAGGLERMATGIGVGSGGRRGGLDQVVLMRNGRDATPLGQRALE